MTTFDKNTDKYEYCPEYDHLHSISKAKLKQRLLEHLNLREPKIKEAVEKTIGELKRRGFNASPHAVIPQYTYSFIDKRAIDDLINSWEGPTISDQYKQKFHDPADETGTIGQAKFNKDAVNWLDQSSYKVTGPFFATHIHQIKQYLATYCNHVCDLQSHSKQEIINYSSIYFAVEINSTKTRFKRSRQQPLVRNKTLVNSKQLHHAFKSLYAKLDLQSLKEQVKKNQKLTTKKKAKGSKYRVQSGEFTQNFTDLCHRYLNEEMMRLGFIVDTGNSNNHNIHEIPTYFRDQASKTNTISTSTNNDNDTYSTTSSVKPPPKPPAPSAMNLPTLHAVPMIPKQEAKYTELPCCCPPTSSTDNVSRLYPTATPLRPPIPHPQTVGAQGGIIWVPHTFTQMVPVRVDANGHPIQYYPVQPPPPAATTTVYPGGYGAYRGGGHIGSAGTHRHSPYHQQPPMVHHQGSYEQQPTLPPMAETVDNIPPEVGSGIDSTFNQMLYPEDASITSGSEANTQYSSTPCLPFMNDTSSQFDPSNSSIYN